MKMTWRLEAQGPGQGQARHSTHRDEEAERVVGGAALAGDVIAQLLARAQCVEHGLVQQLHQQLRHAALEHRGAAALVVVDGAAVLVFLVEGLHPAAALAQRHLSCRHRLGFAV